jgi:hypothetical protein
MKKLVLLLGAQVCLYTAIQARQTPQAHPPADGGNLDYVDPAIGNVGRLL